MRKPYGRIKRRKKRLWRKYMIVFFTLTILLSPFSSVGIAVFAETEEDEPIVEEEEVTEPADAEEADDDSITGDSHEPIEDHEGLSDEDSAALEEQVEADEQDNGPENSKTESNDVKAEDEDNTKIEKTTNASSFANTMQNNTPNPTEDGFGWEDNGDGTVTITDYSGNAKEIDIPSEIDGKTVIAIGKLSDESYEGVFYQRSIEKVTIPNTVETIGGYAFNGTNLSSVSIPGSVETIGYAAFSQSQLTEVTLSEGLKEIQSWAFDRNKLESIEFPNSIESIHGLAFSNNKIKTVKIPPNVTEIANSTFSSNEIETVEFHDNITKIGSQAFLRNRLTSIEIPEKVSEIGSRAFVENPLESITVHADNQEFIGHGAKGLYSKNGETLLVGTISGEIDENAKVIGNNAFNRSTITSIIIPENIEQIEDFAFSDSNLSLIKIHNDNIIFGENIFLRVQPEPSDLVIVGNNPSNAKTFADANGHTFYTFAEYNDVKTIESVSPISDIEVDFGTVWNDLGLPEKVEVTVSPGNETKEVGVRWSSTDFSSINSGTYTVTGKLDQSEHIVNPNNIIPSVNVIVKDGGDADYVLSYINGELTISDYVGNDTDLVIPDKFGDIEVKNIGKEAFANKGLTSVVLPNSLTTIGSDAFMGNKLSSISLPESVKEIGSRAFIGNKLITIVFPINLEEIEEWAFGYNDIQSISIPENVQNIGEAAFVANPLQTIEVDGNNSQYKDINGKGLYSKDGKTLIQGTQSGEIADGTVVIGESAFAEIGLDGEIHIPNTVETISSAAFAGDEFGIKKNMLKKVEIPSNVKKIEPGAFFNVDLEELILHEGLETIGDWAFAHNTLVTVEIPSSMEYVGYYAFGQNDIKNMIIKAEEIFIREDAFDDNQTNSKDLTIYGYGNSTDVKSYADDNGYTFRSLIDYELNSDPENFGFGDIINVLDSDGEIIATLEIPENDATNGELGGAHIIVNAVDETDVVANGLEIAGAIVDIIFVDDGYDPDNLEDSIIKVEDMGDFILSLRVNEDAPTDIAMYHELGHDDWDEVGGKVANGFITATVTNFSKYGVFAEVSKKPVDPEDPDDPTKPGTPDPEDPTKPGTPDPKDPEFDPCDSQDPIAAGCPEDRLKDDNGDPKVTVKGDDKTTPKSGGLLPKTATEMFNYLLVGSILLVIGVGTAIYIQRRKRATK